MLFSVPPFTIRGTSLLLLLSLAVAGNGQDLGELARRERSRQNNLPKHAPVLTEDDLQRERILPRNGPPGPWLSTSTGKSSPASDEIPQAPTVPCDAADCSLGELARQLRLQRERQRAAMLAPSASGNEQWDRWIYPTAGPGFQPVHAATGVTAAARRHSILGRPMQVQRLADGKPSQAASTCNCVLVKIGDSLSKIAKQYLGNGRLWAVLWKANSQINDPNLIRPGQMLRLPTEHDREIARINHSR